MSTLKLTGSSSGSTSLQAPASGSDRVITFPDTAGTVALTSSAGKILQVVSNTKTDIFSSTAVQSWTDIGGVDQAGSGSIFCVKITPSATSSKILIHTTLTYGTDNGASMLIFRLMRDSTGIAIADAANDRPRGTFAGDPKEDAYLANAGFTHLDSPSSTSELTYNIEFYDYHGNTFYVNRSYRHWDASTYDFVGSSNITVMEVAG